MKEVHKHVNETEAKENSSALEQNQTGSDSSDENSNDRKRMAEKEENSLLPEDLSQGNGTAENSGLR